MAKGNIGVGVEAVIMALGDQIVTSDSLQDVIDDLRDRVVSIAYELGQVAGGHNTVTGWSDVSCYNYLAERAFNAGLGDDTKPSSS